MEKNVCNDALFTTHELNLSCNKWVFASCEKLLLKEEGSCPFCNKNMFRVLPPQGKRYDTSTYGITPA